MNKISMYVLKCKDKKGFLLKSSIFVAIIMAIISAFINTITLKIPFNDSLISGAIFGLFVLPMWYLFIRQSIKFGEKQKKYRQEQDQKEKEMKRKRAEEKMLSKKNNKKKNKKKNKIASDN